MSDGPVLIAGHRGLMGGAFLPALAGRKVIGLGSGDLDPADADAVRRLVVGHAPGLVVNCAADTDVEGAEAEPERAFAVNATLAGALARAAFDAGAGFIHLSSTGCYGDWKDTPYTEADPLRPTTVHHRAKAFGEERVLAAHPGALVLRLGWVFGGAPGQRKNFVWARLREAEGKAEIGSNPHQVGCPTPADAVAAQAIALSRAGATGVFNGVGEGAPASRLDYVTAILRAAGSAARVVPVVFPRRAPVSPNEAAVNTRLSATGALIMPPWREALGAFVRGLAA